MRVAIYKKTGEQKVVDVLPDIEGIDNEQWKDLQSGDIYDAEELDFSDGLMLGNEHPEHSQLLYNISKTYAAKNHDYGNSFDQSLDEFGLVAGVIRMGDKFNRLKTLAKAEAKVKDESVRDTLLDLANYAIMSVMWIDKNKK